MPKPSNYEAGKLVRDLAALEEPMSLTDRERNVLTDIASEGGIASEGYIFDALYYVNPPLRAHGMRTVARNLARKGLVTFGAWLDESAGCELHITDEGKAAIEC